jgi:hypothetical protein
MRADDPRLRLAVALVVVLALVGVVLATRSSDGGSTAAEAPTRCVQSWNEDPDALGIGSHSAGLHGYARAWVVFLDDSGEPAGEDDGTCAVVFPSEQLDVEPEFAVTLETDEGWRSLALERPDVGEEQLAALQREGIELANADLLPDGSLVAR